MSLPLIGGIGVIAYLLSKKKKDANIVFPYTLYNCNIGRERIVNDQIEYDSHIAAGFVTDLSLCPIDSAFGRDWGEWDYPDSVDDMEATIWTNEWQTTDQSNSIVVIWSKQKLTYDPLQERRGYYKAKSYCIGNLERNTWNYDGDSIRTFATLQAAIDYYTLISDTSGGGSGGGLPDDFVPEVFPDGDDDVVPTPQPIDPINPPIDPTPIAPIDPIAPINPINPPSGFNDFNNSYFNGGL